MNDAAHPSDNVSLLLAAFEEIKGSPAHPEDVLEAARLVGLPLAPVAMISRMRHVAQRNGPGWKPSRLRYFANPIADLLKDQPVEFVSTATQLYVPAEPEVSLTEEERMERAQRLRQMTREKLNHGR